jgi:hypothetical protein
MEVLIMRQLISLIVLLVFLQSSTVFAKDVCVQSSFLGFFIFKNVKIGKKPFVGEWLHGLTNCNGQLSSPVMGIADEKFGTVRIGVTAYMPGCPSTSMIAFTMAGDKDFNATGEIDRGSNGIGNKDGTEIWTAVDCSQIP